MATLTVHIDESIKEKTQNSIKKDGITLTFLISQFLKAYIDGKIKFSLIPNIEEEYIKVGKKLSQVALKKTNITELPSLEKQFSDI